MAPGGDAVGRRDDGLVVFVPGGTPGDRVEVAIAPPRKGLGRGRLLRVLSPGPNRVTPACALAASAQCGGCPLMAVRIEAQLAAKEAWVRRALRKSTSAANILPILAPTAELGYRLRARLMVRDGKLGYASARSHHGVFIASCAVLLPALDRVLFGRLGALVPLFGEGTIVRGLLGQMADQPAVHLAVHLGPAARRQAVRAALYDLWQSGEVCGVILHDGNRTEYIGQKTLKIGESSDLEPFEGSAEGFAQPSAAGHALLPQQVAAAIAEIAPRPGQPLRLLELFSGSGNLTRALQGPARTLLCIEGDAAAVARAQACFASAPNITMKAQAVEAALLELVQSAAQFDAAVLDPPRIGAREALPLLARLQARRIVYVSCDSMTLGRDLEFLVAQNYFVRRVQPIDLAPHTAHVECVAVLEKRE